MGRTRTPARRVSRDARSRLTVAQAQRLCGIDETICKGALDALVDAKFLCVKPDGTYTRLTDGAIGQRERRRRHQEIDPA